MNKYLIHGMFGFAIPGLQRHYIYKFITKVKVFTTFAAIVSGPFLILGNILLNF